MLFTCCRSQHVNDGGGPEYLDDSKGGSAPLQGDAAVRALHDAAQTGDLAKVELLLQQGVDINAVTEESYSEPACIAASALVLASRQGHEKVVRRLLEEPTLDTEVATRDKNTVGRCNQTAFTWACRNGQLGCAMALASDPRVNVNALTANGFSPFLLACQGNHYLLVRELLKNDKVDHKHTWSPPNSGETKFDGMVLGYFEQAAEAMEVLVLEGGIDVNEPRFLFGEKTTFLRLVCKNNSVRVAKKLLSCKADPNVPDEEGKTPFEYAYENNFAETMMNLLLSGADATKSVSKVTAAQIGGEIAELATLLRNKEVKKTDKVPALHAAAVKGDTKSIKAILKALPDPLSARDLHDGGNMPAAFYAIELAHRPAVKTLLIEAHGLTEDIANLVIGAIKGKEDSVPTNPGERTFASIFSLIEHGCAEDKKHAKGAAALLMPWMGSVMALKHLKPRPAEFDLLRDLCRRKSQGIYDTIDTRVGFDVLKTLGQIRVEGTVDSLRQDMPNLLPTLYYFVNEEEQHRMAGDHEIYYGMSLALLAQGLQELFKHHMEEVFGGIASHMHYAPPKTWGRMYNKLMNVNDHGDPGLAKPRPAKNVDIIRACIEMENWEDIQRAIDALGQWYRILRVKNSHDPTASGFGGYRSLLVNFEYKPGVNLKGLFGDTFRYNIGTNEFDVDDEDKHGKLWLDYVDHLPQAYTWKWGLTGLAHAARRDPTREVVLSAEVQIIYTPYMVGRSLSHLLFKISRCETGAEEMVRDFAVDFTNEERQQGAEKRLKAVQGIVTHLARNTRSSAHLPRQD